MSEFEKRARRGVYCKRPGIGMRGLAEIVADDRLSRPVRILIKYGPKQTLHSLARLTSLKAGLTPLNGRLTSLKVQLTSLNVRLTSLKIQITSLKLGLTILESPLTSAQVASAWYTKLVVREPSSFRK